MGQPLESPSDVVVIGAGVIGCSVALELARRGRPPLVVDKGPAPGHGSTSASSAIVRFTYSTLAGTAMAYEGLEYWRRWGEHVGIADPAATARFVECGLLLFDDRTGFARKVLPLLDEVGVVYEWWDSDELATRLPQLDTREWWPPTPVDDPAFWEDRDARLGGALFTPEAGYVTDPQLAAQNLADAAARAGARFAFGAEVVAVERDRGAVTGVTVSGGSTVVASVVVNVAGPHSRQVNAMADLGATGIGTRALRQQVHHVSAPPGVDRSVVELPVIGDFDSGIYVRPDVGSSLLVGGTEPECDPLVWVDDPDAVDQRLDPAEWETQMLRLARRIPALGVPHARRGLVGLYDVSDDWLPVYDRADLDGYYVAIGTSGNQFKNAGIVGHCLAELIAAVEAGHDHDRDPLVVTGPHTGLAIDLGTFSRRREIDQRSSFSVFG